MFVNVRVEFSDHIRLVTLEIFLAAHGNSEEDHFARCHDLVHFGSNPLKKRVVKEFVTYAYSLAFVERLKQVVETAVFKSGLKRSDLIFTCVLKLSEQGLYRLALLGTTFAEETTEDMALLRVG